MYQSTLTPTGTRHGRSDPITKLIKFKGRVKYTLSEEHVRDDTTRGIRSGSDYMDIHMYNVY